MEFPKYKRGDRVVTRGGTRATITKWTPDNGKNKYLVEANDGFFKLTYEESELKFDTNELKEDKITVEMGTHCPKCHSKWKITPIGTKKYYDCTICKEKAEDILAKQELLDEEMSEWSTSEQFKDYWRVASESIGFDSIFKDNYYKKDKDGK